MDNNFPAPSGQQARVLWFSLTALAVGVLLGLLGLLLWGAGWVLQHLSSVLLPLAIAGILAYLLDPVVDFLERRRLPRMRAIFLVYFMGVGIFLIALLTVVPRIVEETSDLVQNIPDYSEATQNAVQHWLDKNTMGQKIKTAWGSDVNEATQQFLTKVAPVVWEWVITQLTRVASWAGLAIGLALIPVYLFYFLLEKKGIVAGWRDYLPLRESSWKTEAIFIIESINNYLILFFRGQILVALCDGLLLTAGFLAFGLNYAFLLGMVAGLLSIVPFLGVVLSLVPTLALAAIQYGDWLHPAMVLGLFCVVQMIEGLFISPKIMGNRVGLHPLTIIIAVMIGTALMGGVIGGILAIPLTAALRVLMGRYVWGRTQA